jgi:hypothetical protein
MAGPWRTRLAVAVAWVTLWAWFWHTHTWVLHWHGHSFIENGSFSGPVLNFKLVGHVGAEDLRRWTPEVWLRLPSLPEAVAQAAISLGYWIVVLLAWC